MNEQMANAASETIKTGMPILVKAAIGGAIAIGAGAAGFFGFKAWKKRPKASKAEATA